MTVTLAAQSEEIVKRKIESGEYQSASEVVQESLRLLDQRDGELDRRREALRKEIEIGIEQLENGEYTEYDDGSLHELVDKVKAEGRSRLRSANPS